MIRNSKLKVTAVLAVGAMLGYLAAAGRFSLFSNSEAKGRSGEWLESRLQPAPPKVGTPTIGGQSTTTDKPACCEDLTEGKLIALADTKPRTASPRTQEGGKKPNILIIWGDDIGWFNPSCYHGGLMGYQTPNIDRIAKEGAKFTDWCGQQSCTAGRAAFIMGQSPIRTGMTKVGLPGASLVRRVFMLVPAQTYVAKWISSFKEFRRGRSRPASASMR